MLRLLSNPSLNLQFTLGKRTAFLEIGLKLTYPSRQQAFEFGTSKLLSNTASRSMQEREEGEVRRCASLLIGFVGFGIEPPLRLEFESICSPKMC